MDCQRHTLSSLHSYSPEGDHLLRWSSATSVWYAAVHQHLPATCGTPGGTTVWPYHEREQPGRRGRERGDDRACGVAAVRDQGGEAGLERWDGGVRAILSLHHRWPAQWAGSHSMVTSRTPQPAVAGSSQGMHLSADQRPYRTTVGCKDRERQR